MASQGNDEQIPRPSGSESHEKLQTPSDYASIPYPEDASAVTSSDSRLLEEGPTMRAVAMLAPPRAGLDTVRERFDVLQPAASKFGAYSFDSKLAPRVSKPANWIISDGSLSCIPEHFVLERTTRFVDHCLPSVIAARISDCLRKRSIDAIFDSIKAKAKCFTQTFVEFRIRLFAGKGENENGVIVEMQRRSGSAVYFRHECCAVFDAAEGIFDELSQVRRPEFNFEALKQEYPLEDCAEESLALTCDLLKKDRLDANLLGIQSLVLLTDAEKSGIDTALVSSKSIVLNDENSELREFIASLIQEGLVNQDEDDALKATEIVSQLRTNAFVVLSNALEVCAKDGCLSQAIGEQQWYINSLVPCLTKELMKAEETPYIALLSAKCLNSLVACSMDARIKAIDVGAMDALASAREIGKARYASLATETERGVVILECSC